MSEEYVCSFPVITPNGQKNSNASNQKTSDETFNPNQNDLRAGQQVQFLKITLQKNRKISCKETYGIINSISDGFAEIQDYHGDIVRCSLSYIKPSDRIIFSYHALPFLNVI